MMNQVEDQYWVDKAEEQEREYMEAEDAVREAERKAAWEEEKAWRISLGIPLTASRFHAAIFADIKEDVPDRQWDDYIKTAESLGW